MKTCPKCKSLVDEELSTCPSNAAPCPMILGATVAAAMLENEMGAQGSARMESPPKAAASTVQLSPEEMNALLEQAGQQEVRETQPMPELRLEEEPPADPSSDPSEAPTAEREVANQASLQTIAADPETGGLTDLNNQLRGPTTKPKSGLAALIGKLFGRS